MDVRVMGKVPLVDYMQKRRIPLSRLGLGQGLERGGGEVLTS